MNAETIPLIKSIMDRLSQAKLRADAALLSIFINLQLALDDLSPKTSDDDIYDTRKLINEILNESVDSPKLFVINLPEADDKHLIP
ncbi:MAG: hypothetical protein WBZ36_17560 [Candidatus Nitrosopolaris sp.]